MCCIIKIHCVQKKQRPKCFSEHFLQSSDDVGEVENVCMILQQIHSGKCCTKFYQNRPSFIVEDNFIIVHSLANAVLNVLDNTN